MKYLNAVGNIPHAIINKNESAGEKGVYKYVMDVINRNGVHVNPNTDTSQNHNVLFSESSGSISKFEELVLGNSKKLGKTNIMLQNPISIYNHIIVPNYLPPRNMKLISGICMKGQRSIDHYKKFIDDVFYLNTGDPDWDEFNTIDFKKKVEEAKKKYDNKMLLLCCCFAIDEEIDYYNRIAILAEKIGFKVAFRTHPGAEKRRSPLFQRYESSDFSHFVLLKAASHAIENISSTIIAEGLFLGTKMGCTPAIYHFNRYGRPHRWIENYDMWHSYVTSKVGSEIMNIVPRINTEDELHSFLSSDVAYVDETRVDAIFGWPKVPNYCSHLFESIEKQLGVA
jgi:hypothetical protein